MTNQHVVELRSADVTDAHMVFGFIRALAAFQGLTHEVRITEEILRQRMAPDASPQLYVIIAEVGGVPVGMAIYFLSFSTFLGTWGIHVEDMYVEEQYRKKGLGRAFFFSLARIAGEHGYARIEFSVLESNVNARRLYEETLGARPLSEWVPMRIDGDALSRLIERPEEVGVRKFRPH